jgi:hypothetical protein
MKTRRRFVFLTLLVALVGLRASASGQCGRSWVAAPNGVSMTNPNYDSDIRAMVTWDPDGAGPLGTVVVAGGRFEWAGGAQCNNIAYYDGAAWHPLGLGLTSDIDYSEVNALAVVNGQLYAGGYFNSSGITQVNNLAKWTGGMWQDAAGGVNGVVRALMANGSELIVGGSFLSVGPGMIPARFAARLTGVSWNPYPTNAPGPVQSGVMFNNTAYFTCSGSGSDHAKLCRWNNVLGAWEPVHTFATETPYTALIAFSAGLFYVDRSQAIYPGCASYKEYAIWRYDGSTSTRVDTYHNVDAFAVHNGELYAIGGRWTFCPHVIPQSVYTDRWLGKWNGSAWVNAPSNPWVGATTMVSNNGALYFGGFFARLGNGLAAGNAARMVGTDFQQVQDGFDGIARCATAVGPTFFAGGDFNNFGSTPVAHLGYFNGTGWGSVGNFNGSLSALGFYAPNPESVVGSGVVASGGFTTINGSTYTRIARRDSTNATWVAMGSGLNAPAYAFYPFITGVSHADLFVGGQFTNAGGTPANYVARWTGSAWQALSTGMSAEVRALQGYSGRIYAGGYFITASGVTCNHIASWTGSSWAPVGGGLNDNVRALALYNGRLIAAGDFTMAGGVPCNHIAAWDGTNWSAVGDGLDAPVLSLVVSGTSLIAGGMFTHSGTAPCSHVAQWDGAAWSGIGSNAYTPGEGVDGNVIGIAVNSNGELLVTGQFTHAVGQASAYAARAIVPVHMTAHSQPTSTSTCPQGSAFFEFEVNYGGWSAPPVFQWYRDGSALADGTQPSGTVISGATTRELYIQNAHAADAAEYWCTVDNVCGEHVLSSTVSLMVGGATCLPPCGSADFNCDGDTATDADIEAFFACLAGTCPGSPCQSSADFDGDGDSATDADIEAFFRVLAGGTC